MIFIIDELEKTQQGLSRSHYNFILESNFEFIIYKNL